MGLTLTDEQVVVITDILRDALDGQDAEQPEPAANEPIFPNFPLNDDGDGYFPLRWFRALRFLEYVHNQMNEPLVQYDVDYVMDRALQLINLETSP